ncbi:MAG: acyltransferase [Oscillospiraceae bacterium]
MNSISRTAHLGQDVNIGKYCVIEDGADIGSNVTIGNNVTIYPGSLIGDDVYIESNAVIGRQPRPSKTSTLNITGPLPPVKIGAGTVIGSGAVIYAGTVIGACCLVGDTAVIREGCTIGNYVIIGAGTITENAVVIGEKTKIQSGAYITAHTIIGENCFIAPMVTTTNDNFMGRTEDRFKYKKGAIIEAGARIGGGAILLPGVTIGREGLIAAGSVVTKDTEPEKEYRGVPAREFGPVPYNELLESE